MPAINEPKVAIATGIKTGKQKLPILNIQSDKYPPVTHPGKLAAAKMLKAI